jgi:hypothetical protein
MAGVPSGQEHSELRFPDSSATTMAIGRQWHVHARSGPNAMIRFAASYRAVFANRNLP